ncbi:hypothetical protein DL96DRAFT_1705705 [Flagelloscypha sp. PMI_526]|nr:hypothetical protein DL96DRAFT_1705705 [Flagelloscypha sp. PMI_526]
MPNSLPPIRTLVNSSSSHNFIDPSVVSEYQLTTAVLSYSWLAQNNLMIDWLSGHITLSHQFNASVSLSLSVPSKALPSPSNPVLDPEPSHLTRAPDQVSSASFPISSSFVSDLSPSIALIGTAAFSQLMKDPEVTVHQLSFHQLASLTGRSGKLDVDLLVVPEEYHEFANVFSEQQAYDLPPH